LRIWDELNAKIPGQIDKFQPSGSLVEAACTAAGSKVKLVIKQLVIVLTSCIFLGNWAIAEEPDRPPEDIDLHGSDCISIRLIRDYTPLSRDSLLIHASGKRSYFVRLLTPTFGMKSSFQLATKSRDDRLCPYGGDSIIVDRMPGGEARIQSISRVTPEQVEQLLIRYGKKEPGDTEDPAPPEISGAEVEELG
jgi:hypothetical protein